jgi:hypothetical protein
MTELETAVLQIFKSQAPTRTGTLKGQVRIERTDVGFNIVSDIYYMPFTEEKWVSKRWGGRANPNEGWFKEAFEMALNFISSVYGKEFTREP